MHRLHIALAIAVVATTASAQVAAFNVRPTAATNCLFQVMKTPEYLSCDNDLDRGVPSICTMKITNFGTDACTGHFQAFIGPMTQATVDQASTTGIATTCQTVGLTPLASPIDIPPTISSLETAARCEGDGTVPPQGSVTISARVTPSLTFPGSQFIVAGTGSLAVISGTTKTTFLTTIGAAFDLANCNLALSAPSTTQSGIPYRVSWSAAFSQTTYEIQEATKPDFSDAKTTVASATSQQFTHTATGSPATYYYRVRASSCRGSQGPYSITASTTITPAIDPSSKTFDIVVPQGSTTVIVQQIHVDGLPPNANFAATVDQPYLTVTPATGRVNSDGTVDLTVRADPTSLGVGTNSGTVTITTAQSKTSGRAVALDSNTKGVPVSVTVATPVTQAPKTPPPATSWLVPAVAHANGIGAQFISDVRLANVNASSSSSYQLTFTASNSDGSKNGRQTKLDLAPGQTIAMNDILRDLFGLGTTTADATGVLEIRTLGTNPSPGTVATSRTYSVTTASGTYGQLVPAVPISSVATAAAAGGVAVPLILSHAGQTVAQRMNVGLVESLGFATNGRLRVFNASGQLIAEVPFALQPFEHQQINSFLARNGINASTARVEVIVDPAAAGATSGGVTAYASMLDNATNDASVITGVKASTLTAKRFVLPGVAEGTPVGEHTEVRILNAGSSAVDTNITFYPRNGSPVSKTVSLGPGETKSYSNVVSSLFGMTGADGSLVAITQNDAQLLITGRTFSGASTGGTFGMLQTAVVPTDGIGNGETAQILQLEESDRFRTDLGLAEITGSPATATVKFTSADSKVSVSVPINLNANEFRSETSILSRMSGITGATYNGRLTISVSGSGRVAAYAALIDKTTNDPTLLPAQK